jgi:hypothetical protein
VDAIWVVVGYCGEYSDHQEWFVAAYPEEGQAGEHARLAEEYAGRGRLPAGQLGDPVWLGALGEKRQFRAQGNPYDLRHEWSDPETYYRVERVPFARHVDEYLERGPG